MFQDKEADPALTGIELAMVQQGSGAVGPEDECIDGTLTHAQALVTCAREFMVPFETEDAARAVMSRALESIRIAAAADRAFVFRNIEDGGEGPASVMVAEALAPDVVSHMPKSAPPLVGDPPVDLTRPERAIPWSMVPESNRLRLASGRALGGVVTELFADTPQFLSMLLDEPEPVRAVLFFPISCGEDWWGYLGLDDCQTPREWAEADVSMLSTAADMVGSTLRRWQVESELRITQRYDRALSQYSQTLLQRPSTTIQQQEILHRALDHLLVATQASRAYIIRNFVDPELGPCAAIFAEVCEPGVRAHIRNPSNQRHPWAQLPERMRISLSAGKPYGGPTRQAFADTPWLLEQFIRQEQPLLSVQTVPIHVNGTWWGLIGFDQVHVARRWTEHELLVLQTGAEMLSSTLERWQAESRLMQAHQELETRVEARTAELAERLAGERILARTAASLVAAEDTRSGIVDALPGIGALAHAGRVVLIEFPQGSSCHDPEPLVLEWSASGGSSLTVSPTQVAERSQALDGVMADQSAVRFTSPIDLPPEAAALKGMLALDQDLPLLLVPLRARNVTLGLLACADIELGENLPLQDTQPIAVMSGLLVGVLEREATLRTLEQRIANRMADLTVFLDASLFGNGVTDLGERLELGLLKVIEVVGGSAASIHLLDDQGVALYLAASQGITSQHRERVENLALSGALSDWLAEANPPLISNSRQEDGILPPALRVSAQPLTLTTQLRSSGDVLGILVCYAEPGAQFSISQISLLCALSDQLALVIHSQRLRQQVERLAVIGERQRLARDLHDAVSQSLYSQTLFVRSAIDALQDGHPDRTAEHLRDLEANATQTMREMRVLLHRMKPIDLLHSGLRQAIEERLTMVERRVGITASAQVDPQLALDETTEAALYRVIIEALNNSLRHAEASQVNVRLSRTPEGLVLSITDDGRGFDNRLAAPGMGLDNMRVRALEINGELRVDSKPGQGTAVVLRAPLRSRGSSVALR